MNSQRNMKEASKAEPCPICGHTDWCFLGENIAICGRVDIPPAGWKQVKNAEDGRPIYVQESSQKPDSKKVININRTKKSKKSAPIPPIKLCELPADREPSPQPVESALLRKPKKAGEKAYNFEDITYRYSDSQWVVRTQWLDPDHSKGRDKTYCQWHLDNGKEIAKKGEKVWPAYRIEEAIAALSKPDNGDAIVWVEGEPNVETLRSLGLASITLMGSSWQDDAIEYALLTLAFEAQPPVVIDLIESDKSGLSKKDKLQSVCAERSIPYVRLFPCDLWEEKPIEIPAETADATDIVNAIGAEEFRRRLNEKLQTVITDNNNNDNIDDGDKPEVFHSKLNRKRVQIERGLGHRLRYNLFKQQIEMDGEPISDWLEDQGGAKAFLAEILDIDIADSDGAVILTRTAKKRTYHPIRDYLNDCWEKYGNDTSVLNSIALRYFGTSEPIHQTYMIKHLIGSVKRIFEPGCQHDTMLILKSEQGMRKSKFFKFLYGEENFTDSVLGTEEKDALMTLNLNWACEYAEFENITTKKEVSALKSWLTRYRDDYRRPYAKTVRSHPRTFILVGSTNRDDFLRDETGERRFMIIPVQMPEIPIEKLTEERDRIWGAAMALYKAGYTNYLDKSERKIQDLCNEDFRQVDPWEEIIAAFLENSVAEFTSTREILEKSLGMEPRQMDSQSNRRVNGIMARMGWVKERRRFMGIQQWGWRKPSVPDVSEAIANHPAQAPTRCLQEFQPSVPDVPDKNSNVFFEHPAQENLNDRPNEYVAQRQINEGDHHVEQGESEVEKKALKNHPAHPAQEAETLTNNESEPVPDGVIGSAQTSGTEELKVGMRVAIVDSDSWNGEKGTIARAKKWMGRVEYWFVAMDKGGERKYQSKYLRKIDEPKEEVTQLDLLSSASLEPGDYLEDVEEDGDDLPVSFDKSEEVENSEFTVGDRVELTVPLYQKDPGLLGTVDGRVKGEVTIAWDNQTKGSYKKRSENWPFRKVSQTDADIATKKLQQFCDAVSSNYETLSHLADEDCDREISIEGKMAVSLWQPWANLLLPNPSTGLIYKGLETRSWETDYRGELVIHAAKEKNLELKRFSNQLAEKLGIDIDFDNLPRGCAIAVCDLVDCIEMTEEFISQQSETEITCGDWKPGRFAWRLENVRLLPTPISVRGYQKLWRVNLGTSGTGISGRELAKRLKVSPSMISEKRDRGFTAWSRKKDPEGIGWVFDTKKKAFFPEN